MFGASPLAVVAAVFSDMFDNRTRGLAITVFSMTVFSGPLFAPFIGGFIVENTSLGWRWTEWHVNSFQTTYTKSNYEIGLWQFSASWLSS